LVIVTFPIPGTPHDALKHRQQSHRLNFAIPQTVNYGCGPDHAQSAGGEPAPGGLNVIEIIGQLAFGFRQQVTIVCDKMPRSPII
jgi:hypothetical protein